MGTQAEVLAELERRVGHPLDEAIVDYLIDEGYINDALDEARSGVPVDRVIEILGERYRKLFRLRTGRRGIEDTPSVRVKATDARTLALAEIFAIDAGRDPAVVAFRRVALKGRLLAPEEVPDWVEAQRGPPVLWGRVPVSPDGRALARRTSSRAADMLAYLGPGSPQAMAIKVPLKGPLRMLKDLAGSLTARYGWLESEATTFVLTGLTPLLARRASVRERSPWGAAGRIVLEVPLTATAHQVLALYRRARASAMGGRRRRRDLSKARADLAVFAFEHNDGYSWSEAMRRWNEGPGGRQHRYGDVRSFAKACHEAFRAVSGERLGWVGAEGPAGRPHA